MTCVVYSSDTIGTDSLKVVFTLDLPYVVFESKLTLLKDKTLCFGFCGTEWEDGDSKETYVLKALQSYLNKTKLTDTPNTNFFIIAMSKKYTYVIRNMNDLNDDNSPYITVVTKVSNKIPIGSGTGATVARVALLEGMSVVDSITEGSLYDNLTGGDIYVCHRSSLVENKVGY